MNGVLAGHFGRDNDQVGSLVKPQGMRGDQVGYHGDIRRMILAKRFQDKRVGHRVDTYQHIAVMVTHQPVGGPPDIRPERRGG